MKEKIFNNINILRKEAGIRQADLAEAVGVTRQTIISLEQGNYTPSVLLAIKIAQYFNKSVEDIFKIR